MSTENIEFINGYLAKSYSNGIAIVDTGSELSLSWCGELEYGGEIHKGISSSMLGISLASIQQSIGSGRTVTGLIGMDILSRYSNWFNLHENGQKFIFTFDLSEIVGVKISGKPFCGLPVVNVLIDGKPVKMILDSGAPVSYIDERFTYGRTVIERKQDFSPIFGSIESDVVMLPVTFENLPSSQNEPESMKFGKLPGQIGILMESQNIGGILGSEAFENWRLILSGNQVFFPSQGI